MFNGNGYMKKFSIVFLLVTILFSIKVVAQTTSKSLLSQPGISQADIVGRWQINSPHTGDNPLENFQFFKNGTFIYNYETEDDTRNIFQLKGKYRMEKNRLFFTVTSRKERTGGGLETGALGTDEFLFVFDNDSTRVVHYKKPKELDPLFILDVKKTTEFFKIKINNRTYYKLSSDPDQYPEK